jgi:coatomer subunit beta'
MGIRHAPNGHTFAVFNDSEYILYRSQTFKSCGFGQGTDLVFAANGDFAVRDSYSIRIIQSNNTQHCELKTDYLIEGLFGGPLLVAKASDFIIFYDWETARVIRRIDVPAKKN